MTETVIINHSGKLSIQEKQKFAPSHQTASRCLSCHEALKVTSQLSLLDLVCHTCTGA